MSDAPTSEPLGNGLVVAAHGRHCMVEVADGTRLLCHTRGTLSRVEPAACFGARRGGGTRPGTAGKMSNPASGK